MSKWTKTDFFIIGVLFALLVGWGPLYTRFIAPRLPAPAKMPAAPAELAPAPARSGAPAEIRAAPEPAPATAPAADAVLPPAVAVAELPLEADLSADRRAPDQLIVLSNGLMRVGISRIGGGIVFAELLKFIESPTNTNPLVMDFAAEPALSLLPAKPGAPGSDLLAAFTAGRTFESAGSADGRSVVLSARAENGLQLERHLKLGDDYRLELEDRFINASPAVAVLPEYALQAGVLRFPPTKGSSSQGVPLGIDTLSTTGGEDVRHWGSSGFLSKKESLPDFFQPVERRGGGCSMSKPAMTQPLPPKIVQPVEDRTDWIAVKNKFFAQILVPEGGAPGFRLVAHRQVLPSEQPGLPGSWASVPMLDAVAATLVMDPVEAGPGATVTRKLSYYVGPKEYSRIELLGNRMVEVMEFGMLRSVCWLLLVCLKGIYSVLPNYGVAIILLTVLIRLVFWPVTHKSTESMRRMQEIQPKIAALREKYKDKPQKIQEETMKLYKEHKVNPLGGCLPMLIQIPVFIALFNVLRSAVELRYAGFLWVTDLSEPEGLFAGVLPIALNILPIIMTATSIWQSYLTPSGGDPAQQKMMLLMPIMMLFIFYNMPAALVLYWTANQVLMIVQLLWQKRKKEAEIR
ncbi:MAG: YidC/Oxa1 family insertase periplasmic-domain containing protein [Kiritimatiellia bacterium]